MILAEKITEERKKNGWSQEELAEKLGVSRQAISKWESAGSVPDLQRIIRMADLFGVSTDYLLKDDITAETAPETDAGSYSAGTPLRRVSMEEANAFLESKRRAARIIANGVSMCILSPCLIMILGAMAEDGVFHVTEGIGMALGLLFLFGMIGAAVYLFISTGIQNRDSVRLEQDAFETEYGVAGMVKERRAAFKPAFTRGIAVGVVLCIVSVVPLVVVATMTGAPDYVCAIFAAVLLALIALGVNLIVRAAMIESSFEALLEEGDFTREEKRIGSKMEAISGAYWCLATAAYLGWSFYSGRWDYTWIVWPVAGVLCGVVKKLVKASSM